MSPPLLKPNRKPGAARQVISQRLGILPCGKIRGGTVGFSCHPTTGELYYVGEIYVRWWFIHRRHRFHGRIWIDPKHLRSDIIAVGLVIYEGPVRGSVEVRHESGAELMVEVKGVCPGVGLAHFDLSKEYVRLKSASISGVCLGSKVFGSSYVTLSVEDGD